MEKRPPNIRLSEKACSKLGCVWIFWKIVMKLKHQLGLKVIWKMKILNFILMVVVVIVYLSIDLISHEIYYPKQGLLAQLEPTIFFCYQTEYAIASDLLREEFQASLKTLNLRSRLPLT